MEIILEHVRSFAERCNVPLRPLTLLVGENSSGKTTFLSVVSCVLDTARFPTGPGFNDPPYNLGTFDTIATYKAGRYGRDESFTIGFASGDKESKDYHEAVATYENEEGTAALRGLNTVNRAGRMELGVADSSVSVTMSFHDPRGGVLAKIQFKHDFPGPGPMRPETIAFGLMNPAHQEMERQRRVAASRLFPDDLYAITSGATPPYRSCSSFAPIRSKPRRTYDELREEYSPEGDHVPTLLARMLRRARTSPDGRRVRDALLRFGAESRLFRRIDVKQLGKDVGDPFQLRVAVSGPPANLTDVGYGVSQALPIVVQSVLKTTSPVMLLQQPEVHLHPRAQAALGSFFADLAANGDRMVLLETHSDHLVDRVRQEVAAGRIPHDRVMILFFDKPKLDTTVWPITLDSCGNVENAPPEYRSFFLEEELKLFNRASG